MPLSRIKVNSVSTTGNVVTNLIINEGNNLSFKNKIINGDMRIDQRAAGSNAAVTAGQGFYSSDRWEVTSWNSSFAYQSGSTVQRIALTSGTPIGNNEIFEYFLRYRPSATCTYSYISTMLENSKQYAGKTYTLSYWIRLGSGTYTPPAYTNMHRFSFGFGSGGSSDENVYSDTESTKPTLTTSWQKIVRQITIPAYSDKTYGPDYTSKLQITLFSQCDLRSNQYVDITGVQFEEGTVATNFERRPFGLELQLCQRYYEKSYLLEDVPGSTNGNGAIIAPQITTTNYWNNGLSRWMVEKRVTPTVTIYNSNFATVNSLYNTDSGANVTINSLTSVSSKGFVYFYSTNAVSAGQRMAYQYVASAEL